MGVRATFARTVVITYCEVQYIDQNNNVHKDTVKLFGNHTLETAQNAARKKLNAKGCIVESVRHKSFYGKMSIEQFAKYCEKSDEKEW